MVQKSIKYLTLSKKNIGNLIIVRKPYFQVASSGLSVQTIPSITNGMDNTAIMGNKLNNDSSDTFGLFINKGRGSVTTNQIDASKIINFSFFFFSDFNNTIFWRYY